MKLIISVVGLRCICQDGYKMVKDFGGRKLVCEACADGEVS